MRNRTGAALIAMLALIASHGGHADALTDLNKAFREAYDRAATHTLDDMRARVPVLVNRFGQISLYRPGVETPDVYVMNSKLYFEARSVAHTAAAMFAGLAPYGTGPLGDERLQWLKAYQSLLLAAEAELERRTDIPDDLKAHQLALLADVRRTAQRIHQQGVLEETALADMGRTVRRGIQKNLEAAAASQLDQFRAQLTKWKQDHAGLEWDKAVVVIVGVHQARNRYLQRQFFDWLLQDQPTREDRVVFAETMTPPPPLDKEEPKDALVLLSKVMLDKGLSRAIFDDPLLMQSDVLGDAAEAVIAKWR
jgi:hypothetical protein